MATNLLQLPVDAPAILPPSHDLVSSAQKPDAEDLANGYWENGVQFVPEGQDTPSLANVITDGSSSTAKSDAMEYPGQTDVPPWIVEAAWVRPAGIWTAEEITALGTRAFNQTQSSLIELKLAEGSATGTPYLIDDNCTKLGTTAVSSYIGLGRIQAEFAKIGGHGTIYVNPLIAASLSYGNTLVERDGKLYTAERGDLVIVANVGAKGTDSETASADTSFMFGHLGEPTLFLGDAQVYEGVDWTTNERTIRIEKTVAVVFAPGQWETLVKP